MILAGTGHRPDKLGGYSTGSDLKVWEFALACLEVYQPSKVISGMALGWDLALAEAAIDCKIPLICAIPCNNQTFTWTSDYRQRYKTLLEKAHEVNVISKEYHPGVMQDRNVWMVDRCDKVLALWNGTKGGTYNCIKYAEKKGKPVINTWEAFKML